MPKDDIERVKSLVSQKYIGTAGIHSVGMRRAKSAVTLYVTPETRADRQAVIQKIEKEIAPLNLLVIEEERASLS